MQKKIIYGEYTLLHWIELILRKNVVLPKYQRHFVWTEEQFNKFIVALKNGNFIPPVIIGSFKNENIILDGQQRLTSVLLSCVGLLPKPDVFKTTDMTRYVDSDEYELEEANAEPIEWTINVFTENSANKSKSDILSNINIAKYNRIDAKYCLSEAELNSIYLGSVPFTSGTAGTLRFGGVPNSNRPKSYYNGKILDALVFNTALSDAQVSMVMVGSDIS